MANSLIEKVVAFSVCNNISRYDIGQYIGSAIILQYEAINIVSIQYREAYIVL